VTLTEKKIQKQSNLANWSMMIGLFFNPFGFDAVQFALIRLTGGLWYANFIMYCTAVLFFGLAFFFRIRYKKAAKAVNETRS
jgi:hypothetical protein